MGRAIRWGLISVVVVLAAAIAAPFLVPVSSLIPELTLAASEKLRQPVTMEDLRLHLLPTPRVVANHITIGKRDQILIGEVEIVPELWPALTGDWTIRLIRADKVAIDHSAFDIPRGMSKAKSAGEPVLVRRVLLTQVKLNHARIELPQFDIDVRMGAGLQVSEARFEARDGSFRLLVEPTGKDAAVVTLNARSWTLPVGTPLRFDTLVAEGVVRGEQLELARIEGELYGGRIAGSARVEWGKQWSLSGRAKLAGVDLQPVQQAMGKPGKLSGRLKADAVFSSRARQPGELRQALVLDGPFDVAGGAYKGVDLSKAGELSGKAAAGDTTTFQELKGNLELRGEHVKLNQLCVRSPKVVAGGNVEVAPDKKLSGRLDVSMAQTGGIVGVPVSLGGTTDDPTLLPTKGYLIGAAIGTVLLPVIGTSIGSSLGGRIEGGTDCR